MQASGILREVGSPHPIPPRRRNLHYPHRVDRAVPRKHSILQRRARRSISSRKLSGMSKELEVVHPFQAGPESPSCRGQGVPKHRSRDQKRSKATSRLFSPNMADLLPPTNGAEVGEAHVPSIQRSDTALPAVGTRPHLSQQRPQSAHYEFRESRRWAESNAEWTDRGNRDVVHTLDRRRISEDLRRSRPLPAPSSASEIEPKPRHRRIPSGAESLEAAHNLSCLSRSLSTGNWHSIRRDTSPHKIQLHHQLGRLLRKITNASNRASKEPTASLIEPDEPKEGDSLTRETLKARSRNPSARRVAKLSKKPGMDNIRARKEAADKALDNATELNADAIINLNAAEDTPKLSEKIPALREQDIEERKRRSADLREVLSRYRSDRHGNLLPEINMDAIGDLGTVTQQSREQRTTLEPAAERRHASEQLHDIESIENTAWKTSNPSSGGSIPSTLLLPPQPGPRISSRQGAATSSTVQRVDENPLAGRSAVSAVAQSLPDGPSRPLATMVEPLKTTAIRDQMVAAQFQERKSMDALSVVRVPPTKSTDTLTAITNEALGTNRPGVASNIADTESVALRLSTRPTKIHSGLISSNKTPGDAPNRPLPDLPEVPSPESSETSRREAGSRSSSRSRRSSQRMSTQPGHNRRTSSLVSIASLDGLLQVSGAPQRRPRSVKKTGSVQSSSQTRSSGLADLVDDTGPDLAPMEMNSGVRSPNLGQTRNLLALAPVQDDRGTVSRDKRIHDKRLQDIASARAMRGKRVTREDHRSVREDPAVEDFPPPPSSRPSSRVTAERQKSDTKGRAPTANTSTVDLLNSIGLQRPQADYTSPVPETPSLTNHTQARPTNRASSRSCDAIPVTDHSPGRVPASISSVTESPNKRQAPTPKHSHASLRSNVTAAQSQTVHGTQTPPLSESSTPSSDEDGTGVIGTTRGNKAKGQKRLLLSANDLAAMIADMHAMREQLDAQTRKLQSQSKQLRAIEMQKLRMVDAVNALVAVASEPSAVVLMSSPRQVVPVGMDNPFLNWRDRDSVVSTSNTIASAGSASSGGGSSDATFLTEPDMSSSGVGYDGARSQEVLEYNMDFDRMHELIRLDRKKVGFGVSQEAKAKGSRRKRSGGSVGYLSIEA